MSFLSSTRQQSRCSSYRILCHVLRKINQQCSGLRTPHIKVTAPERSTTSAYRMRLNVSLFRNHLSASKYGYKRTYSPLRSLFLFTHHLLSPFPLSFPPYQGRSFSQPPSSRCVFSFHSKVGRFVLVLKVGRSLSTPRWVISI